MIRGKNVNNKKRGKRGKREGKRNKRRGNKVFSQGGGQNMAIWTNIHPCLMTLNINNNKSQVYVKL